MKNKQIKFIGIIYHWCLLFQQFSKSSVFQQSQSRKPTDEQIKSQRR